MHDCSVRLDRKALGINVDKLQQRGIMGQVRLRQGLASAQNR
jgi:hypothetical protein